MFDVLYTKYEKKPLLLNGLRLMSCQAENLVILDVAFYTNLCQLFEVTVSLSWPEVAFRFEMVF